MLILDEIDQLILQVKKNSAQILYKGETAVDCWFPAHSPLVFEWVQLPESSLILIGTRSAPQVHDDLEYTGIANALDLTDRVLPHLRLHHCTYIDSGQIKA